MAIHLFLGWPGMGKTLLMHDLIREQAATQRFFIVGRADEWLPSAEHWRGQPPPNLVMVPNGERWPPKPEKFQDFPIKDKDGNPLLDKHGNELFSGVYVFEEWEPLDVAQAVLKVGNTTFVDDEIDTVATQDTWRQNPLKEIVHRGRHMRNVDGDICENHIFGAARRPQGLATDLTAIADEVFIFKVGGSRTLSRLREDSYIEDSDWDSIRQQETGQFKHWPSGKYLEIPARPHKPGDTRETEIMDED